MTTSNTRALLAAVLGVGHHMAHLAPMQSKRAEVRIIAGHIIRYGYKKAPQTVAQNKRAASKAKNRQRHRQQCRGAA